MRRLTISVDEQLATQFDELIERKGYLNRSEPFRDLVRGSLEESRLKSGTARHCIARVSYVYNHHERNLATRLTEEQHEHHDLTVSAMHVHLIPGRSSACVSPAANTSTETSRRRFQCARRAHWERVSSSPST